MFTRKVRPDTDQPLTLDKTTPIAMDEFTLAAKRREIFLEGVSANKEGVGLVFKNETGHTLSYFVNNGAKERKIPAGAYAVFSPNNGGEFNVWQADAPLLDANGEITGEVKTISTFPALARAETKMADFATAKAHAESTGLPLTDKLSADSAKQMIEKLAGWNEAHKDAILGGGVSHGFYEVQNPVKLVRVPNDMPAASILKRGWGNSSQGVEPGSVIQLSGESAGYADIYINGGTPGNKGTLDQFITADGRTAQQLAEANEIPVVDRTLLESTHTKAAADQWQINARAALAKAQGEIRAGDDSAITRSQGAFAEMAVAEQSARRNPVTREVS